jgi:2-amino-4-hydroxy-6-hydroxymethyldihydropteridine diphosphokinase
MALIGIGANLPNSDGRSALQTCQHAVAMLDRLPGCRVAGLSRWFESEPVPPSGQPSYINAVAMLLIRQGKMADPAGLLAALMALEAECGRQRAEVNAARTLDLDIIAIDGLIRQAPDPILPHPRAHLRAFVLAPLIDVAPDWMHPTLQRTARALLADLPPQAIRPL